MKFMHSIIKNVYKTTKTVVFYLANKKNENWTKWLKKHKERILRKTNIYIYRDMCIHIHNSSLIIQSTHNTTKPPY